MLEQARAQDADGTGVGPGGRGTLEVLAREVRAADDPDGERPWLLYLQGGPGSGAPRPARLNGWQRELTTDFRLLLLDQRGTGARRRPPPPRWPRTPRTRRGRRT